MRPAQALRGLAVIALGCGLPSFAQEPDRGPVLFANVRVWDGTSEAHGHLIMKDGVVHKNTL